MSREPRYRRDGHRFSSAILPRYMRRSPPVGTLTPTLYLRRGMSSGDFGEVLEAILAPAATGLSANMVTRLWQEWSEECRQWGKRDLAGRRYVYWWADSTQANTRLEDERTCILVLKGAREDGTKELVPVMEGYRESRTSCGTCSAI